LVLGTLITQIGNRTSPSRPSEVTGQPPLINSLVNSLFSSPFSRNTLISQKKVFIKWFTQYSPELTGLANMVAGDLAEESYFEPVNPSESGRNKVLKAERFEKEHNMRQQDFSQFIDIIITGEGYGWMGKLDTAKVEGIVQSRMKERGIPVTKYNKQLYYKANFADEDLVRPQKYRYMASSTVENIFDNYKIIGFKQQVGATHQLYEADEVIHYVFLDIDGKPQGFTPVLPLVTQLELLRFMWRNMNSISKNSGQPDRIFAVEDIDINSPSFKRIEDELKKYVKMDNRHGSLLMNGKFNIHDLQQLDSMQYKEMGLYITGLIAMQWRIPRSRIPYIVGGTNTKDDTGGNSEKAYWRNVEMIQDIYLNLQNTQLWIPHFGVKRKFKKSYKHDELVETQTQQARLNNLSFVSDELAKNQKRLTAPYKLRYVNGINEEIREEDVEDIPEDERSGFDGNNPAFRQDLSSNKDLEESKDDKNKGAAKRNEALASQRNTGAPTGFGKEEKEEPDKDKREEEEGDHAMKELEQKEVQRVSIATFMELYNEDKAFNKEPPRLFMSERDGITKLKYKSTDFVYETMLPTGEVSKVMLMNFIKVHNVQEDDLPVEVTETKLELDREKEDD